MFDKNIPYNDLPFLPGDFNFNKIEFLKLAIEATGKLEKLNGLMYLIPNKNILISPLLVNESVESSAIENINTTTLKVLESKALPKDNLGKEEKEVLHYHDAILKGYEKIKKEGGIGFNTILEIQSIIKESNSGIRKIPGTVIANSFGEVIYTPPSGEENINNFLKNLEKFINNFDDEIDALIKMPVIHYQFEAIHPFYDGNGRTGRILNILYLILAKKLDFPILFLSQYINENRENYYKLLNKTTKSGNYDDFIIFILKGIIKQAEKTGKKILKIKELMERIQNQLSELNMNYYKITEILFSFPFLNISSFSEKYGMSDLTGKRIVKKLEEKNIISSKKVGTNKLIFIKEFIELLSI